MGEVVEAQAAVVVVKGAEGGSVGSLPLTAADDWITLWEARTPIRAAEAELGGVLHITLLCSSTFATHLPHRLHRKHSNS